MTTGWTGRAISTRDIRQAEPETWVPITFDTAEVLRRADGRLVSKVYEDFCGDVRLYAPRWAADAALHARARRGAVIKLIRRAHKDRNVRDALLAAIEAGGDLVEQLAVTQARKE